MATESQNENRPSSQPEPELEVHSLTPHSSHQSGQTAEHEIEQPSLAPTDRGKDAWLMLASCCVIQLPVWGVSIHDI